VKARRGSATRRWPIEALSLPLGVPAGTLAFALGRTVARGQVAGRVQASPRFAAVDEAIGTNGFPLNLLNGLCVHVGSLLTSASERSSGWSALTRATSPGGRAPGPPGHATGEGR